MAQDWNDTLRLAVDLSLRGRPEHAMLGPGTATGE